MVVCSSPSSLFFALIPFTLSDFAPGGPIGFTKIDPCATCIILSNISSNVYLNLSNSFFFRGGGGDTDEIRCSSRLYSRPCQLPMTCGVTTPAVTLASPLKCLQCPLVKTGREGGEGKIIVLTTSRFLQFFKSNIHKMSKEVALIEQKIPFNRSVSS